jgi:CDP-diacylglycerol--glycerol-3-phosphate 3-phosphatidyltransferase
MIPVFIIIICGQWNWGTLGSGEMTLPVYQLVGAILFAVASYTDHLDGSIARKRGLVTNFGKFADPLADKMLVMTAFILLVGSNMVPSWVIAIIVCRELAVTGLRLILVETGGQVLAAAWPGKIKTATQMIAIVLLYLNNWPFALVGIPVDQIMLYICLFFTVYSGVDYFVKNGSVFKGSM